MGLLSAFRLLQLLLAGVVLLPDTRPTRFWFVIVRITSSKRILHLADGLSSVSTDASKARKTGFRPSLGAESPSYSLCSCPGVVFERE